jgi:hypothetical protein
MCRELINKKLDHTDAAMKLLTTANTKIKKGESLGYYSSGIHLAPAKLSGFNTCQYASIGCTAACLNTAGMGVYSNVQLARINKTKFFFENKQMFLSSLYKEIESAVKKAKKNNMIPCFRFNLTSDIPWENVMYQGKSMMQHFPDIIFYDYTKSVKRMIDFINHKFPENYHLTFSRSESNHAQTDLVMGMGGNVAMVFEDKLPTTYKGKKVINGDENDLRFLDPSNCIVGLVAKGKGKKDDSGFVIRM